MFDKLRFVDDELGGVRAEHRFPNGWGVSVIRGKYSFGGAHGFYELGVLNGDNLDYDNPVCPDGVRGWLRPEQVSELMEQVAALSR